MSTVFFALGLTLLKSNLAEYLLVFGSTPSADVQMPYVTEDVIKQDDLFRIHYNFTSGALLITALSPLWSRESRLKKDVSFLLMANIVIEYGGADFQYTVEFPDLNIFGIKHEQNCRKYVHRLELSSAPYMATSYDEDMPLISFDCRSKTILGRGSYGEVHKAVHIQTGAAVAIKRLDSKVSSIENSWKEVKILKRLSHESFHIYYLILCSDPRKPKIIRFEDTFKAQGQICIVMELAANDLRTHLNAQRYSLPLNCAKSIGRQALLAVEYLHANKIMHRDLKPENILMTNWDLMTGLFTIKLADFGGAGQLVQHTSFRGSEHYMAPENIRARKYNEVLMDQFQRRMIKDPQWARYNSAVDIWLMGKILMELTMEVELRTSQHI